MLRRSNTVACGDELDRLTGRAHPDFYLGAHRNPFDSAAKNIDEHVIQLVATVVADRVAEETP